MTMILAQQAAAGAAAAIQKPVANVTNAFAAEVDGGRAMLDAALRWLAENGASFVVSLLVVALLMALVSSHVKFGDLAAQFADNCLFCWRWLDHWLRELPRLWQTIVRRAN